MNTKITYDKFLVYTAVILFLTWVTISIISPYRHKTTVAEIRPAPERDIQLFQDPQNNCEYVVTSRGGIHLRLSIDGLQLGCTEEVTNNLANEELQ